MIHASTQTARPRMKWQDLVTTKKEYMKVFKSGMAWVWFPDFPSMQEFDEYLENKEATIVAD